MFPLELTVNSAPNGHLLQQLKGDEASINLLYY